MTNRGLLIRAIIFFAIIAFLAVDFYMKEKYSYMLALLLGSIAFVFIIRMMKKDKEE